MPPYAILPPNLADLGVKRRVVAPQPDLLTLRLMEGSPLLAVYEEWCRKCGVRMFAGGTLDAQGPPEQAGHISSGYRSEIIDGNRYSAHRYGLALDIRIGRARQAMVIAGRVAASLFCRVGLYPDRHFIHVDIMPDAWLRRYNKARYWVAHSDGLKFFDAIEEAVIDVG